MNKPFTKELNKTLAKQGWSSLKDFYRNHSFSFSYEYLRQIFSGEKIPQDKIIAELSRSLGLDVQRLQKNAIQSRVTRKVRLLYKLPSTSSLGKFSEKIEKYKKDKKIHLKLLQIYDQLGEKEKKQAFEYLKFLRNQCRRNKKRSR